MNTETKMHYERKLAEVVEVLKGDGYTVYLNPSKEYLPVFFQNYEPDIVGVREDGGVVVEIKSRLNRVSVDNLQAIAEKVTSVKGWRFWVVTLEDADPRETPLSLSQLPTWGKLINRVSVSRRISSMGYVEPSLLYLWATLEASLRRRAIEAKIPVERMPPLNLLRHMYSKGEVSVNDIKLLELLVKTRNVLAHGGELKDADMADKFLNSAENLVSQWAGAPESGLET